VNEESVIDPCLPAGRFRRYALQDDINKIMQAYCVKCGIKQEMESEEEVQMKAKGGRERKAMKGKCPKCGTTMFCVVF